MKNCINTLILLIASSVISTGAPDLIGSWKSNKELTVQAIRIDSSVNQALKKKVENLFGRMTVTYEKRRATIYIKGENGKIEETTNTYKITASTSKKTIIRWVDSTTGQEDSSTLNFVSPDRYWVKLPASEKLSGREYFDRLK